MVVITRILPAVLGGLALVFIGMAIFKPAQAMGTGQALSSTGKGFGESLSSIGTGARDLLEGIGTGSAKLLNPLFTIKDLVGYSGSTGIANQAGEGMPLTASPNTLNNVNTLSPSYILNTNATYKFIEDNYNPTDAIALKRQIEDFDGERINVVVGNQNELKASDFQKFISGFQILNPDLHICNLEKDYKLNIELTIEKGRGYVPAEENKKPNDSIGTIALDSIYTPVKNVKYEIENYRVEQKTDYEKLVFEIITDGSIHPKDALTEAAKTLIHHFMLFSDELITLESDEIAQSEAYDEESLHMRQLLKTKLIDMDLSVRALNCLKAAEVDTLGDLVSFNKNDLMKFRNFGRKSLTELEELVILKGLSFGMDLSKYKLDKD